MKRVGDTLKEARESKGFTQSDISKFTKMHTKFINALEEGKYEVFSNSVHARGFLKNYAEFLNLSSGEIIALWRREYKDNGAETGTYVMHNGAAGGFLSRFQLSPQIFIGLVILAFFTVFGWYMYGQYVSYAGTPPLLIESPGHNTVTSAREIIIKGTTSRYAKIYVNNDEANVTDTGSFRAPVRLEDGVNEFSIRAESRMGKYTETRLVVVHQE